MTESADIEMQRLDRLEMSDRRRKWDSILMGLPRDVSPSPIGLSEDVAQIAGVRPDQSAPELLPVLEFLIERVDRLERQSTRLDETLRRLERRDKRDRRARSIALIAISMAVGLTVLGTELGRRFSGWMGS